MSAAARRAWFSLLFAVLLPAPVLADNVPPPASQAQESRPDSVEASESGHKTVWELPAVTVEGTRKLHEEDRVGANQQPRWTAHRRFTTTPVYVLPEGFVEFSYWLVPTFHGGDNQELETLYEIEFGLPHRFQLDVYAVSHKSGKEGTLSLDEQKVEVRYALADWGRIPANPTLYLEWIGVSDAPDHIEGKLLLGGEVTSGWHWGVNGVYEHEMGGEQATSRELSAGISRTIRDGVWSFGAEGQAEFEDTKATRGDYEKVFQLGPSLQLKPLPRMHIDLVPLFPLNHDAPDAEVTAIVAWEF